MTAVLRLASTTTVLMLVAAATASAQVAPPRDARPPSQRQPAVGTAMISGSVTMAGSAQPARKVRVSLSGAELRGGRAAITDDHGRFSFTALPAGRYNLSASRPGHVSVTYGQRRPGRPGTPIQLSDGQKFQADLQIPKGGVITDDKSQPAPEFTLIVFPADSRYWTLGTRRIQSARPATDGRYTFRNLPPGDYRIAPVYDLEPGAMSDPAFLQQLEATALRVTLQPGEKKAQDMRVGRM